VSGVARVSPGKAPLIYRALDATPVIGTAKNVIELFTGDWLADKEQAKEKAKV
jgi:hypothetical protein